MDKGKITFVLAVLLMGSLVSCGAGSQNGQNRNPGNANQNNTPEGTPLNLTFEFTNQIDAANDDLDSTVAYPDSYTVPLYVRGNGLVSLRAADFPRMVLRVCSRSSTAAGCDILLDGAIQIQGTGVQEAADIVLDACGLGRADSGCGENDPTVFTGSLSDAGVLSLSGVIIRPRVFLVKAASDGHRAADTDRGLMTLDRIPVRVTTGPVAAGSLSATGSAVSGADVTLVAAGTVPASIPELGGASYLATLFGQFDVDPVSVLE